jgi:hypothetical protein
MEVLVRFNLSLMAAVCAAVAMASTVQAADTPAAAKKGGNVDQTRSTPISPAAQQVATASTAYALARYGDANKDPLALVVAAKMLKEVGQSDGKATRTKAGGTETKDKPDTMTVDAILARAKALGAGRADIVALADDVSKGGTRGNVNGPQGWRSVVSGRTIDTWRVSFRGGETAAVALSGDGDSDLDLYVYDENNNLICQSTNSGDDEFCRFSPRWTGTFYVRVKNYGIANQYILRTN